MSDQTNKAYEAISIRSSISEIHTPYTRNQVVLVNIDLETTGASL